MSECHVVITSGGVVTGNYCSASNPHPTSEPQLHAVPARTASILPTAVATTFTPAQPVATSTSAPAPPPDALASTGIDTETVGLIGSLLLIIGVILTRLDRGQHGR